MTSTSPPPVAPDHQAPQEEAPSRFDVLLRRRRNLLIALLLLLIAAAVVLGSVAVFSSSSVNPENVVSSGSMAIDNSKEGAAIFTAAGMVPGDTADGTVRIRNAGNSTGTFSLSDSDLSDTPGANGGNLSEALDLTITDVGPDGAPGGGDDVSPAVYAGPFNAMPTVDLGSWSADEEHTYQFTVEFRDTGTPGSATTGDNAFAGSRTTNTYNWDATSE